MRLDSSDSGEFTASENYIQYSLELSLLKTILLKIWLDMAGGGLSKFYLTEDSHSGITRDVDWLSPIPNCSLFKFFSQPGLPLSKEHGFITAWNIMIFYFTH